MQALPAHTKELGLFVLLFHLFSTQKDCCQVVSWELREAVFHLGILVVIMWACFGAGCVKSCNEMKDKCHHAWFTCCSAHQTSPSLANFIIIHKAFFIYTLTSRLNHISWQYCIGLLFTCFSKAVFCIRFNLVKYKISI